MKMQHKNSNIVQLRAFQGQKAIQDVDLSNRKVKGYFASFDNIDSHRDMLKQGAFAKSIHDRGPGASGNRRIAHLFAHNTEEPIGRILELKEDNYGLYFVSEIIKTQKGDDVLIMYQEGVIREHSIGYNYIMDKLEYVEQFNENGDDESYWIVKEVKLWEGSSLVFGSNSETPYLGAEKSETIEDKIARLNGELTKNLKILANGKGSDELLQGAEYNILLIQKAFNDIITTPNPKAVHDTLKKKEPETESEFFSQLAATEKKPNFFKHL